MLYRHIHYEHEGGTKDYDLWILGVDKKALVIKRWGKIGATGQVQVKPYDSFYTAENVLDKEITNRRKKGYRTIADIQNDYDASQIVESIKDRDMDIYRRMEERLEGFFAGLGHTVTSDLPDAPPAKSESELNELRPESWGTW